MKLDSNKKIIIVCIALFLLSASYLSFVETRQADLNVGKNWWSISFINPKTSDTNFTIENHSDKSNFHWEILQNNSIIQQNDISINNGSAWTSNVQVLDSAGKIIIRVSSGSDKKEIYKN